MVDEEQIKVSYLTREGYKTQAYINPTTGEGTNKHSDIPVIVAWSDEADMWVQTDDWEWAYNPRTELFEREN